MNIGILGTGMVGQALGSALAAQGHAVMFGTRDVERTLAGEGTNAYGVPVFGVWYKDNANKGSEHKDNTHKDSEHRDSAHLELGTFAEAARFGDLLVNATNGMGSLEALHAAGADNLGSKILIDVANELDFSGGMPPRALATTDRSLGEAIQAAFPTLRVVKTLNTINASVMVDPALVPGGDKHGLYQRERRGGQSAGDGTAEKLRLARRDGLGRRHRLESRRNAPAGVGAGVGRARERPLQLQNRAITGRSTRIFVQPGLQPFQSTEPFPVKLTPS